MILILYNMNPDILCFMLQYNSIIYPLTICKSTVPNKKESIINSCSTSYIVVSCPHGNRRTYLQWSIFSDILKQIYKCLFCIVSIGSFVYTLSANNRLLHSQSRVKKYSDTHRSMVQIMSKRSNMVIFNYDH